MRDEGKPAHRTDRWQRFAAKAECPDLDQIVIEKFRGRMAFNRQIELVLIHAFAIIADADQGPAAIAKGDVDPARPGIDGILGQFLDDARRALDHLARGDAVGDAFRKSANLHGAVLPPYWLRRQSASSAMSSMKARTLPDNRRAEG
jgi:hypothetical protein